VVSGEMADVAKKFGTPRRTVLEDGDRPVTAAVPLQLADEPCGVVLSVTGLLARIPFPTTDPERTRPNQASTPSRSSKGKASADAIVASAVTATTRGMIGVITSAGRLLKVDVLDIPVPAGAASPGAASQDGASQGGASQGSASQGGAGHEGSAHGVPLAEFVTLADDETALALAALPAEGAEDQAHGIALGTANGTVKRVQPDYPAGRDEFELITLKDDDRVVGAVQLTGDDAELVFIATDAQLLRFPAASVRPQGRPAGGMAGIKLADGESVVWFGAVGPDVASLGQPASDGVVVVTVAGRSGALPGTGAASVKVTPFAEFPAKGRATGGVRCQRFLKGEDGLIQAWVGPGPVLGMTAAGTPVDLSEMTGRRDGSGTSLTRQLAYIGTRA